MSDCREQLAGRSARDWLREVRRRRLARCYRRRAQWVMQARNATPLAASLDDDVMRWPARR